MTDITQGKYLPVKACNAMIKAHPQQAAQPGNLSTIHKEQLIQSSLIHPRSVGLQSNKPVQSYCIYMTNTECNIIKKYRPFSNTLSCHYTKGQCKIQERLNLLVAAQRPEEPVFCI
jgi:hypothetical protein